MKWLIPLFLLPQIIFGAELTVASRFDLVQGDPNLVISRGLLKTTFSAEKGIFKFYLDAFGDFDSASEEQIDWRRAQSRGYLQEGYVEIKKKDYFLKIGRQAARWSESWTIPSLDVWTARRYNRLFIDPLSEQLVHSTGLLGSISKKNWSLDVAVMVEKSEDHYPKPLPEKVTPDEIESVHPGARLKFQHVGFEFGFVLARALAKNTAGAQLSYAFEKVVPKLEIGTTVNEQNDDLIISDTLTFASMGADLFFGDLVLAPQLTMYKGDNPYETDPQTKGLAYLSLTWTRSLHEIQFQGFSNTVDVDQFAGIQYSYHFFNKGTLGLFAQNYHGDSLTYTGLVQSQAGENLYGLRLQWDEAFEF